MKRTYFYKGLFGVYLDPFINLLFFCLVSILIVLVLKCVLITDKATSFII